MISLIHTLEKLFPVPSIPGYSKTIIIFGFPLLFIFHSLAEPKETYPPPAAESPAPDYINYAQEGSYENESWFGAIPQWHYFDIFGNKILDGYYLYGLTMDRNTQGSGISNIALHPLLKKILNGLVVVSDLHENSGLMVMVGDRIKTEFTPYSLKQTLFAGSRFDAYYKNNALTFLTNRISNSGYYGMYNDEHRPMPMADWITGIHGVRHIGEIAGIGGSYVNLHHEENKLFGNPYSGVDSDTSAKTPTGLSLYGLDANLKHSKLLAYGEYAQSQEFLDGSFKPKSGAVATLNSRYDFRENWRFGGEFYTIGSRFKTTFHCPAHPLGDQFGGVERYQYSLIDDNDDNDDYPENGRTKYDLIVYPAGDPDGVIPVQYDRDKNGVYDYEEDFLGYEADPFASKILFDRNNNDMPDAIENDAYPDYPYVPGYYLPGEKYYRYDDMDGTWEYKEADSLTHKGLAGGHLFSRYKLLERIIPDLELTVGGIFEKSQEKTFQTTYQDGAISGEKYDDEYASNLYVMAHYVKDIARDKFFAIDNYSRRIKDNIPNHTQGFRIFNDSAIVKYFLIPDKLDYRDVFASALRAEFTLFRNRGFNFASAGKYEFQKHFAQLEFDYPDENISSFMLVNKCEYIYLLPFFKDLFLIPRYKNVFEYKAYGPNTSDSLDVRYRRNSMINAANVMCKWQISTRTALSTGLHAQRFNDFIDKNENYYEPSFSIQLMLKDRFKGYAIALSTAFTQYGYFYDYPNRPHNSKNNVHGVEDNLRNHVILIKAYCGFM